MHACRPDQGLQVGHSLHPVNVSASLGSVLLQIEWQSLRMGSQIENGHVLKNGCGMIDASL